MKELHDTIDRLISEVRLKDDQLAEIKLEICKANRDYERLSVLGAIRNLRMALEEAETEIKRLQKDFDDLIFKS